MKRLSAASLSHSLRRTRTGFASALLFLGCGFLLLNQAWAENAAPAGGTAAPTSGALPTASTPAANATNSASLPSSSGSVFTMLLGLVAVLALMAGIAWLFKRFGIAQNLSGNAAAKVVGGVSVGTRERVMVIEVGEQWIVVGVAPGRVNALATMPRQELATQHDAKANAPAFASWLKQTMDKRNGGAASGSRHGNDGSTT
ncbi:MAG: Flagellar protein FliO [Herbaspirillum frisingense]|uniref:Flagellar protein n=1 Tax=Herbaspirillum frisingense TaxID=92645 RepID=A0A7V8FZL1_9BURK|nr:MAG: Flagellar protein FliO [Herbaspirillum frisingense]